MKYTTDELREAAIADLEADLSFSLREDPDTEKWEEYRESLRVKIARLRSGETAAKVFNLPDRLGNFPQ